MKRVFATRVFNPRVFFPVALAGELTPVAYVVSSGCLRVGDIYTNRFVIGDIYYPYFVTGDIYC